MMPRTTLCHLEIRATKAVKGCSQCSFQRRPQSLQQLITNTPAELEGAELRHKHFLTCAFSKTRNIPTDGKKRDNTGNCHASRLTVQCDWLHKQHSSDKHRAELHLPFSLGPAGQALSAEHPPVLQEQTTAMTTLSK